jgi:hypothetical protein
MSALQVDRRGGCGIVPGMPPMRALKDRWRGDRQGVARRAVERLVLGEPTDDLPIDRVDGRIDLRSLWLANTRDLYGLPADPLVTAPTATDVTWCDIDLSGSTFRILLRNAHLTNIKFDGAGWPDWDVEGQGCGTALSLGRSWGRHIAIATPACRTAPQSQTAARGH